MKHVNFAFLVVLLLAIAVRSFIPVGFMADTSSKTVALTICSGLTTKTVFVQDETPSSGHQEQQQHEPCPFAPPVLADNSSFFNVADFISIAYAPFHPHQNSPVHSYLVITKSFMSQGPPENFVA